MKKLSKRTKDEDESEQNSVFQDIKDRNKQQVDPKINPTDLNLIDRVIFITEEG